MAAPSGAYQLIRASVATSTAITVNQILAPAQSAIEITRAWCNQDSVTTTNQTRIQLNRCATVGTVTSQTPTSTQNGMQASKCVGGTSATGITATIEPGTATTIWSEGFNIVNGILFLPVPETRALIVGAASGTGTPVVTLKFPGAPASAAYTTGQEWLEYAG
jgi:hypothetical protein